MQNSFCFIQISYPDEGLIALGQNCLIFYCNNCFTVKWKPLNMLSDGLRLTSMDV